MVLFLLCFGNTIAGTTIPRCRTRHTCLWAVWKGGETLFASGTSFGKEEETM